MRRQIKHIPFLIRIFGSDGYLPIFWQFFLLVLLPRCSGQWRVNVCSDIKLAEADIPRPHCWAVNWLYSSTFPWRNPPPRYADCFVIANCSLQRWLARLTLAPSSLVKIRFVSGTGFVSGYRLKVPATLGFWGFLGFFCCFVCLLLFWCGVGVVLLLFWVGFFLFWGVGVWGGGGKA